MRKLFFILFIFGAISSCKCKKKIVENNTKTQTNAIADCPVNAQCAQAVLKDSALLIEKDVTGKPFYTVVEKTGTTVYRYTMSEDQDQQYVDGGYREEIIFELPSNFNDATISGRQILQTKALFGVFCYCKGKAGYYFIQEGTLTKNANSIVMEIPAIVEGQKVRTVKLKL